MIICKVYNPIPRYFGEGQRYHYFDPAQCYHCGKDFHKGQIVYEYNGFEFDTVFCLHEYDKQANCMADQLSREDRLKALTGRRANRINQETGRDVL